MKNIHGGDIYRNNVKLDFSVNVNPLGIPKAVTEALHEAVDHCHEYPDIKALELKEAVAGQLGVSENSIVFGNGASEIFMAIVHTLRPKKAVIPVPSFYGYEYAAEAAECEIRYVSMEKENSFLPGAELFGQLQEDADILFLANPNNPTGKRLDRDTLKKLLDHCKTKEIYVVLDECFIPFCEEHASLVSDIENYPNLLLVHAFTKIYSIPGVRLGFLISSDHALLQKIAKHLPEWNLSVFAQRAGIACVKETAFVSETVVYVKKEREYLTEGLQDLGIEVVSGEGNFILFYANVPLYERLLKRGILIRDCRNYKGLSEGYFRIAVKAREENEILLRELGECLAEN